VKKKGQKKKRERGETLSQQGMTSGGKGYRKPQRKSKAVEKEEKWIDPVGSHSLGWDRDREHLDQVKKEKNQVEMEVVDDDKGEIRLIFLAKGNLANLRLRRCDLEAGEGKIQPKSCSIGKKGKQENTHQSEKKRTKQRGEKAW